MINKDKVMGYVAGLTTAALLCSSVAFAQNIEKTLTAVYNNIKIVINGDEVTPTDANGNTVEPFIVDGTTYLPVRAISNALGQDVGWDSTTNTVYIGTVPENLKAAENSQYRVNNTILDSFSDVTLANINSTPVKGSFYNLFVASQATDEFLRYQCDNFSPDKTLQTLTIDGKKAANVIVDEITDNYCNLYGVYTAAKKAGFTDKSEIKTIIDEQWSQFNTQFESDDEKNEFFKNSSISPDDFKKYLELYTVCSLYSEEIYAKHAAKTYSESELLATADKKYVKVKHILVEDDVTAKAVLSRLKKGTSFDKLVAEYNTDPGQGEDGYTFTEGEMVKEFEQAAFALAKSTYTTTPVKSQYGYHIIYRYPIDSKWVAENKAALTQALAVIGYNNEIDSLMKSAKVSYTQSYEKYLSTIE